MGFFSDLLSGVGTAVQTLLPGTPIASVAGLITGATAPAAAASPLTAAGQAAVAAAGGRAALIAAAPGSGAPASPQIAPTAAQLLTGIGGAGAAVGQANVFTQTVVQRIQRGTNAVLSSRILRGSPFLMNAEVRALKRITKMINKAHGKIPRKAAAISQDRLNKAVSERVMELSQMAHLIPGHNGHHGGGT